jgi:hypothetical protein
LPIANGGTGQTTANAALNALLPSQTSASGRYLKSDGTNSSWDQIDISSADITGTLPIANGGTGQTTAVASFNALNPMTTTGDIIYESSPTTAARLGIGSTNQVLTVVGGLPAWANAPSASIVSKMIYDTFTATASQTTFTTSTTYTSGKIQVFFNGVQMRNGSDVTVTSGTQVVFASGLASGSLVDLVYPI